MAPSVEVPSSAAPAVPSREVGNGAHAPESSKQPQTKRNRIQLSCSQCRHAKLKCDREKPCSQCIKKGRASLCTFPPPATRKRPAASMQNRLKHLENLVKGVMTGQVPSGSTDSSSNSQISNSPAVAPQYQTLTEVGGLDDAFAPIYKNDDLSNSSGQVVLGPNESTYVGATHWAAILDDVRFGSVRSLEYFQLILSRLKK
jgi:hypothetical protein